MRSFGVGAWTAGAAENGGRMAVLSCGGLDSLRPPVETFRGPPSAMLKTSPMRSLLEKYRSLTTIALSSKTTSKPLGSSMSTLAKLGS